MKQLSQIVPVFLLWLAVVKAFLFSGLHHRRLRQQQQQQQQFSVNAKRKDASAQWDDDDDWKAEDIEVHIPPNLLANFEEDVGKFVTVCAIKTYKGYLKNFNDEISQVIPSLIPPYQCISILLSSSSWLTQPFFLSFIPSFLSICSNEPTLLCIHRNG